MKSRKRYWERVRGFRFGRIARSRFHRRDEPPGLSRGTVALHPGWAGRLPFHPARSVYSRCRRFASPKVSLDSLNLIVNLIPKLFLYVLRPDSA